MRNLTAVKLVQYLSVEGRKVTWVITDQLNFHLQVEKNPEKTHVVVWVSVISN